MSGVAVCFSFETAPCTATPVIVQCSDKGKSRRPDGPGGLGIDALERPIYVGQSKVKMDPVGLLSATDRHAS